MDPMEQKDVHLPIGERSVESHLERRDHHPVVAQAREEALVHLELSLVAEPMPRKVLRE